MTVAAALRHRMQSNPPCPTDPAHGPLHAWSQIDPDARWRCPSHDHDGRSVGHPRGPAPQTSSFFSDAQVNAAAARERAS